MVGECVLHGLALAPEDEALVAKVAGDLPMLSDMCRADLLLYCRAGRDRAVTVAQARPHSFTTLWADARTGVVVGPDEMPSVVRCLGEAGCDGAVHTATVHGTTVARGVFALCNGQGRVMAALSRDSFWLAHERHLRRSKVFQVALDQLVQMVLRGELLGAETLSPFGENDGIVFVGSDRRIQYISGIASALYRQVGYRDGLVGRRLGEIEAIDRDLVSQAMAELRCSERTVEHHGLTWARKVLPLTGTQTSGIGRLWSHVGRRRPLPQRQGRRDVIGAFVLLHDETEALQREAELQGKMAMLREVHHRVKNNLQIIASLTRMQARRVQGEEARRALEESVQRISSVAVVHEFLSHTVSQETISLQEIARRIVSQIQDSLLAPEKKIELRVLSQDAIWLPAESATRCALVINELVQNAIEHGMAGRTRGAVEVDLEDDGHMVTITVTDDGVGLPSGFSLERDASLGLQIVQSMVERDLRGRFSLLARNGSTKAIVRFAKSA